MGFQKDMRPTIRKRGGRESGMRLSTAGSTALDPRGMIALGTTSTAAPVVYDLSRLPKRGDEFYLTVSAIASSSVAPFHINASTGSYFGTTGEGLLVLSKAGDAAHIVAFSSARWAVVGLTQADSSDNFAATT